MNDSGENLLAADRESQRVGFLWKDIVRRCAAAEFVDGGIFHITGRIDFADRCLAFTPNIRLDRAAESASAMPEHLALELSRHNMPLEIECQRADFLGDFLNDLLWKPIERALSAADLDCNS